MNDIVKIELSGDTPERFIRVPELYNIFAEELTAETPVLHTDVKAVDYYRHHEEQGLCGLKYVHYRRVI